MRIGRWPGVARRLGIGAIAAAAVAAGGGCVPEPGVGAPLPPGDPGAAASFAAIEQDVIVPRCATAGCHAGDPAPAYPPLDPGVAYDGMVGAPSLQASMWIVEPFAPERSYLVLKLRGDAGSAGGTGTPMPLGESLDEATLQSIEAWIQNGAPND